jgi:hypothetical protein
MYRWLAYGGQGATSGDNFSRREFSFTLANDIYIRFERASLLPSERPGPGKLTGALTQIQQQQQQQLLAHPTRPCQGHALKAPSSPRRYLSYSDADEWKAGACAYLRRIPPYTIPCATPQCNLCSPARRNAAWCDSADGQQGSASFVSVPDAHLPADMVSKLPHKMDLGAVYTAQPKQKNFLSKEGFKEVEREFIIDIDLTDYQEEKIIQTNCLDPGNESFKASFKV